MFLMHFCTVLEKIDISLKETHIYSIIERYPEDIFNQNKDTAVKYDINLLDRKYVIRKY